ncbi:RNA polymerase sigma factor SigZ [Motilimonas pumila]|uniref:RNA polymerase sigma factor SigZ n=1 Tax=Motilimonas pumila TaxID=2303987 RepID=A0A418YEI9_9GAMM|nr:RNA polymerase sigma factor SigZ [Motilimonas pumila]RJG47539.1 RNA polymerase sigma factor SigZ [Motilimonas pumila]
MISEWQNHKKQLRQYISKRLDDASAIDDILQDVYLKASSKRHQLKSTDSLLNWLYRISHNAIMDYYRQRKTYEALPDNLAAQQENKDSHARQELAQCLVPLIKELPEKYAIALQLSELEGMPQQAIAQQLGLSLSGAKSRVQRSRVKFREHLLRCCDFEVGQEGVNACVPKDARSPHKC